MNLLFIAVLEVLVPFRIEGVGRSADLQMPLLLDHLCDFDQALTCVGIGEAPFAGLSLEKIAFGDPPPGLIRMATLAPSIQSSPDVTVELPEGLAQMMCRW